MDRIGEVSYNKKTSQFFSLDSEHIFIERTESYDQATSIIESFANNWFIGFIGNEYHKIKLRSGKAFIDIIGPCFIILPPFSLVEWELQPGEFKWYGFFFRKMDLNIQLPCPVLHPWDQRIPKNKGEIYQYLKLYKLGTPITTNRDNSALSEKVKTLIDQNFQEELKIDTLAERLRVHRSFLSRCFKKSFGLTPVEYRHKLRVFEALKVMNQANQDITYAAVESGFSSIQRFEDHFNNIFGITPKEFHFSRIKD